MSITCSICNDLLLNAFLETYSTQCGHLFHHVCLIQWIERSRTCPQCRCKTTEKTIHKVYFNSINPDTKTDPLTLQCRYDNLFFEFKLKEQDLKKARAVSEENKTKNVCLKEEIRELEKELAAAKSVIHAHKEQISYFKARSKEREKLGDEVQSLKEELRKLEHVQLIISGSKDEVDDMLRHNRDPESLVVLVSTLRKELVDASRRKKQLHLLLKEAQREAMHFKREVSELNKEVQKLRLEIQTLKNMEDERNYLKNKIKDIVSNKTRKDSNPEKVETSPEHDTSIQRIIQESLAPLMKIPKIRLLTKAAGNAGNESPTVEDKVKMINTTSSPYLPVKSSSIGLPTLLDTTRPLKTTTNKFSIFKPNSAPVMNVKRPQGSYDGMGGYTKEEILPSSPNKDSKVVLGVKRHRSLSSVGSSKLKKLGESSRTIDNFLK